MFLFCPLSPGGRGGEEFGAITPPRPRRIRRVQRPASGEVQADRLAGAGQGPGSTSRPVGGPPRSARPRRGGRPRPRPWRSRIGPARTPPRTRRPGPRPPGRGRSPRRVGELGEAGQDVADPAEPRPFGACRASVNAAMQALASGCRPPRPRTTPAHRPGRPRALDVVVDDPAVDPVGAVGRPVDLADVVVVEGPAPEPFELPPRPLQRHLVARLGGHPVEAEEAVQRRGRHAPGDRPDERPPFELADPGLQLLLGQVLAEQPVGLALEPLDRERFEPRRRDESASTSRSRNARGVALYPSACLRSRSRSSDAGEPDALAGDLDRQVAPPDLTLQVGPGRPEARKGRLRLDPERRRMILGLAPAVANDSRNGFNTGGLLEGDDAIRWRSGRSGSLPTPSSVRRSIVCASAGLSRLPPGESPGLPDLAVNRRHPPDHPCTLDAWPRRTRRSRIVSPWTAGRPFSSGWSPRNDPISTR